MPKPAFFVDGHMESRIFEKMGCGFVVRRIDTNGRDVAASAIAKKINLLFRTLNNNYFPIYILVDLEGRTIDPGEFALSIKDEMLLLSLPVDQFRVHVANRMIENWILADSELLSSEFPGFKKEVYEGKNGKSILRSFFQSSRPYQELTDGVELFMKSSASRIRENSESFRVFFDDVELSCWWMDR